MRFPEKPRSRLAGKCIPKRVLAITRHAAVKRQRQTIDPVCILRHCHDLRDCPLAASCRLLMGFMGKCLNRSEKVCPAASAHEAAMRWNSRYSRSLAFRAFPPGKASLGATTSLHPQCFCRGHVLGKQVKQALPVLAGGSDPGRSTLALVCASRKLPVQIITVQKKAFPPRACQAHQARLLHDQ